MDVAQVSRRRRGDRDTARSTAARCSSSPRTSPSSAARSARCSPRRSCKVMDLAMKTGAPVIGINDSGGARIQEGVVSSAGYGEIFCRNVRPPASSRRSRVDRRARAPAARCIRRRSPTSSSWCETLVHVHHRPDVVKTVTGEDGHVRGARRRRHPCQDERRRPLRGDDEADASRMVRALLSYLPSNNLEDPPWVEPARRSATARRRARDDHPRVAEQAVRHARGDRRGASTTAISSRCSRTTRRTSSSASRGSTAARSAWSPISRSSWPACSISTSSEKAARFVRFCDCFNVPLVTFVDVPGFLPGTEQEYGGIIRHGAKLLYAYAEATVPKMTVITRKAYGGAYDVMSSKHIRADVNFAWPTAEIAVMGPDAAVKIILPARDRGGRGPGAADGRTDRATTKSASPTRTSPPSAATSTT